MEDRDLPTLVLTAQAGDPSAFGELVRRFQDMAYGYAYAILKDFQLAEDAAQEALIEAYRCLPKLEIPQAFPSWLKRIILKHCDRLTRGKRPITTPLDAVLDADTALAGPVGDDASRATSPTEVQSEQTEITHRVLRALDALTEDQRTVTTLYYINGYAYKEIAAFLDVPSSTVKSRLYTSRERLRERMMEMVKEELKGNALPDSFAEETLRRAINEAAALNAAGEFDDAEDLLRDIIAKTPATATSLQTAALRELNRALMWGQYRDEVFDERRGELAANARAILARDPEDEAIWRETARTLLYMPRMDEAIDHIEAWVRRDGPNLDRLGMLAWAKGCVGDYSGAEADWQRALTSYEQYALQATSRQTENPETEGPARLREVCKTLVDCFAAASRALDDEKLATTAARIAREGWSYMRRPGATEHLDSEAAWSWANIYHLAGLDAQALARELVDRLSEDDPVSGNTYLGMRAWYDGPDALLSDWRPWVAARIQAGDWQELEQARGQIRALLRRRHRPDGKMAIAAATLEALEEAMGHLAPASRARAGDAIRYWRWERYDVWPYLSSGDIGGAEQIAVEAVEALGLEEAGPCHVIVAAASGTATPRDIIELVHQQGPTVFDPAGLYGWYVIGREAAVSGEVTVALDALQRVLACWTNPPLTHLSLWEADRCWSDLRSDRRWHTLFDEARARIGPIYGQLHYFPGW